MPNWCYQHMTVVGQTKELEKFRKAMTIKEPVETKTDDGKSEQKFIDVDSLNHFYPTPQDLVETIAGSYATGSDEALELAKKEKSNLEKYGYKNWYDWNNDNWGTKWGAGEVVVGDINNKQLTVSYESAWSPASGLIKNISGQYPKLIFAISFTEESSAFAGWEIYHKGELIKQQQILTDLSPKLNRLYEEIGSLPEAEQQPKYDEFYELADEYRSRMVDIGDEDLQESLKSLAKKIKNVGK